MTLGLAAVGLLGPVIGALLLVAWRDRSLSLGLSLVALVTVGLLATGQGQALAVGLVGGVLVLAAGGWGAEGIAARLAASTIAETQAPESWGPRWCQWMGRPDRVLVYCWTVGAILGGQRAPTWLGEDGLRWFRYGQLSAAASVLLHREIAEEGTAGRELLGPVYDAAAAAWSVRLACVDLPRQLPPPPAGLDPDLAALCARLQSWAAAELA